MRGSDRRRGGCGYHKSQGQVTFLAGVGQPVAWTSGRTAFQAEEMAGAGIWKGTEEASEGRVKRGQSGVGGTGGGWRWPRWLWLAGWLGFHE